MSDTKITVRGCFRIETADGKDITPTARKERALMALLAMSSGHKQTRAWVQSKLWSEKEQSKASANLRRALANLNEWFGPDANILVVNRIEIALHPSVIIDLDGNHNGKGELLETVDAPDPEFEDWIRDIRAADHAKAAPTSAPESLLPVGSPTKQGGTVILIQLSEDNPTPETKFLSQAMVDALSKRLEAEGAEEIYVGDAPGDTRLDRAAAVLYFELTSLYATGTWSVHLRALADRNRRFLWSGRFSHRMEASGLVENLTIEGFVSQALSQVLLRFRSFRLSDRSPLIQIQRSASRLYFQGADKNPELELQLKHLSTGESASVALAWRSFARLVEMLEYNQRTQDLGAEAEELSREAIRVQPGNPLVTGLAARLALDGFGDVDKARFFAQSAMLSDDTNPYALLAQSRVQLMGGDIAKAHQSALDARVTAKGMPHIFAWDMEVCLTALGLGDLRAALEAAKTAYRHNPTHRAALRYMVALSLLLTDHTEATRATKQLQTLEPEFEPSHLKRPDYPVLTLRKTGYVDAL